MDLYGADFLYGSSLSYAAEHSAQIVNITWAVAHNLLCYTYVF